MSISQNRFVNNNLYEVRPSPSATGVWKREHGQQENLLVIMLQGSERRCTDMYFPGMGASRYDVHKSFGFFDPSPLSAFGTDVYFTQPP